MRQPRLRHYDALGHAQREHILDLVERYDLQLCDQTEAAIPCIVDLYLDHRDRGIGLLEWFVFQNAAARFGSGATAISSTIYIEHFPPSLRSPEACGAIDRAIADAQRLYDSHGLGSITDIELVAQTTSSIIQKVRVRDLGEPFFALKSVHPTASREVVQRFNREVRLLSSFCHDAVAKPIRVGCHNGRPAYLLPWAAYGSLDMYASNQRSLAYGVITTICQRIADALVYIHAAGVVHRDIKPGNVLLFGDIESDGAQAIRLADFGLAHAGTTSTVITQPSNRGAGTPYYMSPEQTRSLSVNVDTRTDIWSLGVVLYELLVGTTPFHNVADPVQLYEQIRNAPHPPVRSVRTAIPVRLARIVDKCLEKQPKHRYQSARDLMHDLQAWDKTWMPMYASRWNAVARTWDTVRMYPKRATAVVVGILLGSIATGTWLYTGPMHRAEAMRVRANTVAGVERIRAEVSKHRAAIASADEAIQRGEAAHAKMLLDGCVEHQRGWEWHYLNRVLGRTQTLRDTPSHFGTGVVFSHDGINVAEKLHIGADVVIRVGNRSTGLELVRTKINGIRVVDYLAPMFSLKGFSAEGQYVWGHDTAQYPTRSGFAQFIEIASGSSIVHDYEPGEVITAVRADGQRLLALRNRGRSTADVYDIKAGIRVGALLSAEQWIADASFVKDADHAVAILKDGTVLSYSSTNSSWVQKGQLKVNTLKSATICQDGTAVAVLDEWDVLQVFDLTTLLPIGPRLLNDGMISPVITPDGRYVVTSLSNSARDRLSKIQTSKARSSGKVPDTNPLVAVLRPEVPQTESRDSLRLSEYTQLYDLQDARFVGEVFRDQFGGSIAGFTPDSLSILIQRTATQIEVRPIDVKKSNQDSFFPGPVASSTSATWIPKTDSFLMVDESTGRASVQSITSETNTALPFDVFPGLQHISCNDNGVLLACSRNEDKIILWDGQKSAVTQTVSRAARSFVSAALHPDGRHVVTAARSGLLEVTDAQTGQVVRACKQHSKNPLLIFSSDGLLLIEASKQKLAARRWQTLAEEWTLDLKAIARQGPFGSTLPAQLLQEDTNTLEVPLAIAFSTGGDKLLVSNSFMSPVVVDVSTGATIKQVPVSLPSATCIVWKPNDKEIFCLGAIPTIVDINTGKSHHLQVGSQVLHGEYSPDGERLAVACADGSVRLLDTDDWWPVLTIKAHTRQATSVRWSYDGNTLLSTGNDGAVRVWRTLP